MSLALSHNRCGKHNVDGCTSCAVYARLHAQQAAIVAWSGRGFPPEMQHYSCNADYVCPTHGQFRAAFVDRGPDVTAPCGACATQSPRYTAGTTTMTGALRPGQGPTFTSADFAAAFTPNGVPSRWTRPRATPVPDPLDVKIDGATLRSLLLADEARRREKVRGTIRMTKAQRDALSVYWSASLRAKVAESKERERCRVLVDVEDD